MRRCFHGISKILNSFLSAYSLCLFWWSRLPCWWDRCDKGFLVASSQEPANNRGPQSKHLQETESYQQSREWAWKWILQHLDCLCEILSQSQFSWAWVPDSQKLGDNKCGFGGLPRWLNGKESACNAGNTGDLGSILRSGRSPGEGNGNPLQYPCLENPMDRGTWRVTVQRVTKRWTWLSTQHIKKKNPKPSPN